jgi:hypothetical protein
MFCIFYISGILQPDQERGSIFLKQLNDKGMTCVTQKNIEAGVPFKGGIVTPMFPQLVINH